MTTEINAIDSFDTLGLAAPLLQAIKNSGYTTPTPIQAKAIPLALAGKDLMAGAQTGTGKTAAFALPLLHRLVEMGKTRARPSALVLVPTRELAMQVAEAIQGYGKAIGASVAAGMNKQASAAIGLGD